MGWRGPNNLRGLRHALTHDVWHLGLKNILRALISKPARFSYVGLFLLAVIASGALLTNMAIATLKQYEPTLKDPTVILNTKNVGTTILDRNGEVLFRGYGAIERHNVPLDQMPQSLVQATLATEDPDFYSHPGFSWRGMMRAAYHDLRHTEKVQGGSTITQQLVKNTMLTNEKSFTRKFKEIVLAVELEQRYSKEQILQMYLNTIYYGQGSYGAEAAAANYFRKPIQNLTTEEAAMLAGLPQSPSLYDPNVNQEAAFARRSYVFDRMTERGYLAPERAAQLKQTRPTVYSREVVVKAPHFVFYVLDQLRRQYGQETLEQGGITVQTSLDYKQQQKAEEIARNQVNRLASNNVTNAGMVAVDPKTGEIRVMVGSIDYYNPSFGSVNVMLSQLQPGSSFKPIAYAAAFEKGWNGSTRVDDKPLSLPQGNGTLYQPQNYDQTFRGPVTLRRALANSLNIPAIEVIQHATLASTITTAHKLGIQAPSLTEQNRYGVSLVLGGGEVRPIDMAAVYASFANQGNGVKPYAVTGVRNRFGGDITKSTLKPVTQKSIDPRIAYMITNILSDNKAREEEFGPNSPLKLSRPAAAKTGTTNDFRDNWTVGYTPQLVTAVWVGNNDHSPMNGVNGTTGAAPIWNEFMEYAHAGLPVEDFPVPAGVVFAKVCAADGGLASANDPNAVNEVFLAESQQTKACGQVGGGSTPQPLVASATPNPSQPANPRPVAAPSQVATTPKPPEEPGRGGGTDPGSGSGGNGGSGDNPTPPNG